MAISKSTFSRYHDQTGYSLELNVYWKNYNKYSIGGAHNDGEDGIGHLDEFKEFKWVTVVC